MKKKLVVLLILGCVAAQAVACGKMPTESNNDSVAVKDNSESIDLNNQEEDISEEDSETGTETGTEAETSKEVDGEIITKLKNGSIWETKVGDYVLKVFRENGESRKSMDGDTILQDRETGDYTLKSFKDDKEVAQIKLGGENQECEFYSELDRVKFGMVKVSYKDYTLLLLGTSTGGNTAEYMVYSVDKEGKLEIVKDKKGEELFIFADGHGTDNTAEFKVKGDLLKYHVYVGEEGKSYNKKINLSECIYE